MNVQNKWQLSFCWDGWTAPSHFLDGWYPWPPMAHRIVDPQPMNHTGYQPRIPVPFAPPWYWWKLPCTSGARHCCTLGESGGLIRGAKANLWNQLRQVMVDVQPYRKLIDDDGFFNIGWELLNSNDNGGFHMTSSYHRWSWLIETHTLQVSIWSITNGQ